MEVPGSKLKPEQLCEPCQGDNVTNQASGFCKDCGEYMCDTCFRHHLRGKLCRHHVLVNLEHSSLLCHGGKTVRCNEHKGETIKFYCRRHEAVGCGDCMVLKHNACNSEYIINISKNFEQNEMFKSLISKVKILASENKEIDNQQRRNEKDNKLMLEKTLGDIRKFRADINKYLDEVEADAISEAKRIMSDNGKLLTRMTQDCKGLSSKIEKIKEMLNTEIYEDNVLFINTVECKPRVTELEKDITLAYSKNMNKFEFACNQQLREFITSSKKLGNLTILPKVSHRQTTQMIAGKDEKTHKPASKNVDSFDRNKKVENPEKKALVGARVRRSFGVLTGTVIAVHPDDTVNVKWDSGRRNDGPFTVGTGYNDVTVV